MKNLVLFGILAVGMASCVYDNDTPPGKGENGLVSPGIYATASDSPFTGILEIYPCNAGTAIYFGNYKGEDLTPLHANYTISNGSIAAGFPNLLLPVNEYNMIYWGVPKNDPPTYDSPASNPPPSIIGTDYSKEYMALRPYGGADTTYMPVYDYVFNMKAVKIGTENIAVSLKRVVAGLNVIFKGQNNAPLDSNISGIKVLVGGVAKQVGFTTGTPQDFTSTVSFPLTIADDRMQATNQTVMLFPSAANPLFQVLITLNNGEVKSFKTNLNEPFTANGKLTVIMNLNTIFSETTTGSGFQVSNWEEKTETIDLPPLQ